jgi:NADPH:quinone reductase-like Zn-dependent oxidoreductase
MRAIIYTQYGPPEVLHLAEVEKPAPKPNEVLVNIHATTVSAGDTRMRKGSPLAARFYNGLRGPRRVQILGFELAGVVEEVGVKVDGYRPGDRILSECGFEFGGSAEYKCIPERGTASKGGVLAHMPDDLSFEEAAALPLGGLAALNILRMGGIKAGQRVLINGASGSVGSYAVQLARHFGAAEITGTCSPRNFDLVRSLGADVVLDYHIHDFTQGDERYDLIYDAAGKLITGITKRRGSQALAPGGQYVSVEMGRKDRPEDLALLAELAASGEIKPVIDRRFLLEQVAEAHAYVEGGHKQGNVVITVP